MIAIVALALVLIGARVLTVGTSRYRGLDNAIPTEPVPGRVPAVTGFDLHRNRLDLPGDLRGATVAVVAYTQRQQLDVDTWLPYLIDLERRVPELTVYEFPTVPPMGVAGQEYLDGVMRAGIRDPGARSRTVTLYVDVAAFNAALGFSSTSSINLAVLDDAGAVRWSTSGRYSDPAATALEQAVLDTL